EREKRNRQLWVRCRRGERLRELGLGGWPRGGPPPGDMRGEEILASPRWGGEPAGRGLASGRLQDGRAAANALAQPPATIQIAHHHVRDHLDRLTVAGALQMT